MYNSELEKEKLRVAKLHLGANKDSLQVVHEATTALLKRGIQDPTVAELKKEQGKEKKGKAEQGKEMVPAQSAESAGEFFTETANKNLKSGIKPKGWPGVNNVRTHAHIAIVAVVVVCFDSWLTL
jgi:hypothetical protein